ncbi:MAG: hypothetical protein J5669_05335 [Bacteroidales bacterium]|nr:hypothetical protein [Bacteroidales bacterium]
MDKGINWKQFLVTLLGTAIGVALSFALSGLHERRIKAHDQRLSAIMIIHDIDNTVESLKSFKKWEEDKGANARLWLDHPESLETAPYDSVYSTLLWLLNTGQDYHFDNSKERIFHSSQDSWQNLSNVRFIDNVQSFYYYRQQLEDAMNKDDLYIYPVSQKEYRELALSNRYKDKEVFEGVIRNFLKEKLSDKKVRYFVDGSRSRVRNFSQHIDMWTRMNDENKFIMGITDQEMDDYINSIAQNGVPVSARRLLGSWKTERAQDNSSFSYEFLRDGVFLFGRHSSSAWNTPMWSGIYKQRLSIQGTWALQGDSLILVYDPRTGSMDLDVSEVVPKEGMKDSLASAAKRIMEESKQNLLNNTEKDLRHAAKVRMDESFDKIEMTNSEGGVSYITRKK